jgi:hypothetical protein
VDFLHQLLLIIYPYKITNHLLNPSDVIYKKKKAKNYQPLGFLVLSKSLIRLNLLLKSNILGFLRMSFLGLLENIFSANSVPVATMSTTWEIILATGMGILAILVNMLMTFFASGKSTTFLTTCAPFVYEILCFFNSIQKSFFKFISTLYSSHLQKLVF